MSEPIRLAITDPDGVATETLSVTTRDGETWYDRRDTVEALHRLLAEARAQRDAAYNKGVEAAARWHEKMAEAYRNATPETLGQRFDGVKQSSRHKSHATVIRTLKREAGDA